MANVEKNHANPAWPDFVPEGAHAVSEVVSRTVGAHSPYGDEMVLPMPYEQTGYVHPYTRINR